MMNFNLVKSKAVWFVLFQIISFSQLFSQVIVEAPPTQQLCVGGNAVTLQDIQLIETTNTDFVNTTGIETYIISVPSANFEFNTASTINLTHLGAGTLSNVSVNILSNEITFNYEFANTALGIDTLILSGIEVIAINTTDAGNIVRSGGTILQNGNAAIDNRMHGNLISFNGATANAGTYASICEGDVVSLSGIAGGMIGEVSWSAPSGSFSNSNDLNATYTPVITTGSVVLTLSNDPDGSGGCAPALSTTTINVLPRPEPPIVSFNPIYDIGESLSTEPTVTSDNTDLEWHTDLSLSADITITSGNSAVPNFTDLGFNTTVAGITTVYVTNTIAGCRSEPTAVQLIVSSGVALSEAENGTKLCVGGNAIAIGDVRITENDAFAFANTNGISTIEIASPSPKFDFITSGGMSIVQSNIGGTMSNLSVTATSGKITISYEMANSENGIDELTISGIRVRAIGNEGVGELLRTGGSAVIAGLEITDAQSFATLQSYNGLQVDAGLDIDVCVGESVNLSGTFGGATSSVIWSGPGTFVDNTQPNTIYQPASLVNGTTETITLTTNDPDGIGGCNAETASININIRGIPPSPTVSFGQNACVGEVIAAPLVTAGTNNLKWHSSLALDNDIVVTSGNPANPSLADLGFSTASIGSFSVYVTQTSTFGCESLPREVKLAVRKVPNAPIITQPTITVCQNDNSPIAITAIGNNLKWYRNDNSLIVASNSFDPVSSGEISVATAGNTTFKVTQTENGCESDFSSIVFEVQALPTTSVINGESSICAGTSGSIYSVTEVSGNTYNWSISGGGFIASGQGTSSIAVNWNQNTSSIENYTITVVEEDPFGCEDLPEDLNVTVNPVPNVSFSGLSTSYSSTDVNSYELTGVPTGGVFYGQGVAFNAVTGNYEFTPSEAGTGAIPVGYQFETSEGCIVYTTPVITNVGVPSASGIIGLNASREYCVNDDDVNLSGNATAPGSGFFFSPVPSFGQLDNDPVFPGNNNRAIFSPSKVGPGTYLLFYRNGLSFGSPESVTVYDIPNAPTTDTELVYCQGDIITPLTASGTGIIKWYTSFPTAGGDVVTAVAGTATANELGLTNTTNSPTPIGSPIQIWVTQTDGNGCESEPAVINIQVNEKPVTPVLSSTIPAYCPGDVLQDIIVSGENGASWEWSDVSDFSSSVGSSTTNGITSTFNNPITLSANGNLANTLTYYVRQQINGCYSDPLPINIMVFPTPDSPVLISTIPDYCPGDFLGDITVSGVLGAQYEWSDRTDFSNLIGSQVISGNTATLKYPILLEATGLSVNTYSFFVRQKLDGCYSNPIQIDVNVYPTPDAPIILNARLAYCHGDILENMVATGEVGADWQWSTSADFSTTVGTNNTSGNNSTLENPIVLSAFGPGTTTINFWVRQRVNGCFSPASNITIQVYPIPLAPTRSGGDLNYCSGSTIESITVSGEVGANFKWYNDISLDDISLVGNQSTLITPPVPNINNTTAPIVYPLWVTQTINGCTSSPLRVDVTINPIPNPPVSAVLSNLFDQLPNFSGSPFAPELCVGDTINDIGVTGLPGADFTWYQRYDSVIIPFPVQPANPANVKATEIGIDNMTPGVYKGFVTQTVNNCESEPRAFELIIHEIPSAPIAVSPDPVCIFQNINNLEAEGEVGATFNWYSDENLTNVVATGKSINPAISNTSSSETDFWVTQTVNNCESAATKLTVIVFDIPPSPEVNQPPTYCVGEQIQNVTATGSNLRWYSDNTLTNQIGAGNFLSPGIDNTTSSVTKFFVTQTFFSDNDFNGCTSAPSEVEVIIYDLPVVSIADLDLAYCVDAPEAILRGIPAGGNFEGSGITNDTFYPEEAGEGSHLIKYYFQNANGCLDSASQFVTVNPLPAVTFNKLEPAYCVNDAAFGLNGFPQGGIFFLNGSPISETFSPNIFGVGIHEIVYSYSDGNSCVNSDTQSVIIHPAPVMDFSVDNFCIDETIQFTDLSTVTSGNIVAWQWDFDDGTTSPEQNPFHIFSEIGIYAVNLTVFTENGCSENVEKNIYVGALPDADFEWANTCVNDEVQFTNFSSVENESLESWFWEFGDGQVSTDFSPSHQYSKTGSYQVKLTAFSETNCESTIIKEVAIFPSIDSYPYSDNFENPQSGWFASGINSSWEVAIPAANIITPHHSEGNAWITNAQGNYNNNENSYVESPCFDLTPLGRPKVSFDIFYNTQRGFDGAVLQSSVDDGETWELVGSEGDPLNWFNTVSVTGNPGDQSLYGWSGDTEDSIGWVHVSHFIDHLSNEASVRFRIAFGSDASFNDKEGFAFDNFRIEDREKFVLLETFTNSSNDNDALINPVSNEQISANLSDVLPLTYHTNFPGVDPLNRDNPADPSARALYYGVLNTPRTIIDGISLEKTDGSPFWDERNIVARALLPKKFEVDLNFLTGNPEQVNIQVVAEALALIEDEIAIQIVCIERDITGITGLNGETDFDWVVRKMLPDAAGTSFREGLSANEKVEVNVSWKPQKIYNPDNVLIAVFIQNNLTKEVYVVKSKRPENFPDIISANRNDVSYINNPPIIFPNPVKDYLHVSFNNPVAEELQWEIVNIEGKTFFQGDVKKGTKKIEVLTSTLSRGLYLIKYTRNNKFIFSQKFIVVE
ncbi:MAG: PKD domain-containing protein [Bacteroidota bacterium]